MDVHFEDDIHVRPMVVYVIVTTVVFRDILPNSLPLIISSHIIMLNPFLTF